MISKVIQILFYLLLLCYDSANATSCNLSPGEEQKLSCLLLEYERLDSLKSKFLFDRKNSNPITLTQTSEFKNIQEDLYLVTLQINQIIKHSRLDDLINFNHFRKLVKFKFYKLELTEAIQLAVENPLAVFKLDLKEDAFNLRFRAQIFDKTIVRVLENIQQVKDEKLKHVFLKSMLFNLYIQAHGLIHPELYTNDDKIVAGIKIWSLMEISEFFYNEAKLRFHLHILKDLKAYEHHLRVNLASHININGNKIKEGDVFIEYDMSGYTRFYASAASFAQIFTHVGMVMAEKIENTKLYYTVEMTSKLSVENVLNISNRNVAIINLGFEFTPGWTHKAFLNLWRKGISKASFDPLMSSTLSAKEESLYCARLVELLSEESGNLELQKKIKIYQNKNRSINELAKINLVNLGFNDIFIAPDDFWLDPENKMVAHFNSMNTDYDETVESYLKARDFSDKVFQLMQKSFSQRKIKLFLFMNPLLKKLGVIESFIDNKNIDLRKAQSLGSILSFSLMLFHYEHIYKEMKSNKETNSDTYFSFISFILEKGLFGSL